MDLLNQNPNITEYLASQQNVTLFAPNDDGLTSIIEEGGIFDIQQVSTDPTLITQALRYHLYRGVIQSESITKIPQFPNSFLNYTTGVLDEEISGSNVTGGQVLQLNLNEEGNPIVTTGIKSSTNIVVAVSSIELVKLSMGLMLARTSHSTMASFISSTSSSPFPKTFP